MIYKIKLNLKAHINKLNNKEILHKKIKDDKIIYNECKLQVKKIVTTKIKNDCDNEVLDNNSEFLDIAKQYTIKINNFLNTYPINTHNHVIVTLNIPDIPTLYHYTQNDISTKNKSINIFDR